MKPGMIVFDNLQLNPQELKTLMDSGEKILLLDVRESDEYNFCKIFGSFNFPLTTLLQNLDKIDSNMPIVTICHHGIRSMKALMILKENGFENIASLRGGVEAWALAIDPTMKRY